MYNDIVKQFFYEGEPLVNKEWKIIENNDSVFPIEFRTITGFELSNDKDEILHIKIAD